MKASGDKCGTAIQTQLNHVDLPSADLQWISILNQMLPLVYQQGPMGPPGEMGATGPMGLPGPQGPSGMSIPGEAVSLCTPPTFSLKPPPSPVTVSECRQLSVTSHKFPLLLAAPQSEDQDLVVCYAESGGHCGSELCSLHSTLSGKRTFDISNPSDHLIFMCLYKSAAVSSS